MSEGLSGRDALGRVRFEASSDKILCLFRDAVPLRTWETEFTLMESIGEWIGKMNLDLDDFLEKILLVLIIKGGKTAKKYVKDYSRGPHVNLRVVALVLDF